MDRILKKKRWTIKRIFGILLAGAIIVLGIYHFVWSDHTTKLNVENDRITIDIVREGPFQEYIPVIGSAVPQKTIYLDAIEGGRVEKIYLEAGSLVKKGQKILSLANTDLLLDIMNRETDFVQLSNDLRNARMQMEQNRLSLRSRLIELDYQINKVEKEYEREKILIQKQIIASKQFQNTQNEYGYLSKKRNITQQSYHQDTRLRKIQIRQIEASLKRMQANLQLVKRKLNDLLIRAPIGGRLTTLNAEIGESKTPGERLGQIDVLEGFKVRVAVDEHYIARINIGQKGEFTFDDQSYRLRIEKIYPEVTDGRFEIEMAFNGPQPEGIRRGQTLRIRLELGKLLPAVLLPRGGFYQQTGGRWIYVLNDTGRLAVKRNINLGRQNPEVFEVLAGLSPGEKVVTSCYDNYPEHIDKLLLQ